MISTVDLKQVTDFLSRYQIAKINPQTLLLTSKKTNYLVKSHIIDGDYDEISEILDKHLSFDPEYVCPLLHFQDCDNEDGERIIRAVYHLDKLTLKDSIYIRQENQEYFTQSQLWILMSSLVNSLIYLQQRQVVYGVLSPNKIFIEEKIRILDPSAFNIKPMSISRLSLHSPEIKMNRYDIDFYQSDVYLLGLCMLSAATLNDIDNEINEEQLETLFEEVQKKYSSDLLHVLKFMLKNDAEERPNFQNILEYIQIQIQIKEAKICKAEPLMTDEEDCMVEQENLQQIDHQNIDILEPELNSEECVNQYEQARQKYLFSTYQKTQNEATNCHSSLQSIDNMDSIEYIGQKDTINLKKSNYYVQQFKLTQFGSHNSHETVLKSKRRAHQIKNRNSENVKTIHSIMIPNRSEIEYGDENHPFTSPELMSMLKQETKRARQFFTGASRVAKP